MRAILACGLLLLSFGQVTAETKPRVFLTDHAVEVSEIISQTNAQAAAINSEYTNTLTKNCTSVTVTTNGSKADYVVVWQEIKSGTHNFDYSIFNRDGDLVGSGSTNLKRTAAKEICRLLSDHK